jgi:hypothetical protein
MPLLVELRVAGQLVGGLNRWWDDMEAWLAATDNVEERYPITASVDPYGFQALEQERFRAFIAELRLIASLGPHPSLPSRTN